MIQEYGKLEDAEPLHPGLESLEDGFCMLDAQWRVTYWNAAAERALGIPRASILRQDFRAAVPFLARGPAREHLAAVALERAPRRFLDVYPPERGGGYLSIYAAPVEGGGLALHFRDATDEVKRADQYSALLESIRDGFIAVDARWNIVYLNAMAEALLRFPRDQALGVSLWSLLPRGPEEIRANLRATMEDGIQRHLREVQPEGRVFRGRIFDVWTYPLAGGGLSVLFEDVSERVQRERELSRFARQADEANQAKSRFFAAISHELRTPLNAIVGYTHLLTTGTYGEIPDAARRAADRAGVCAEHLARLVDDVLLLTTAEIGRLPVSPAHLSLAEYLPTVVEPLRHQAEAKGLRFVLDLPADLPLVETDAQRLRQLLNALLSNAVKYTSRGQISLVARVRDAGVAPRGGSYTPALEPVVELLVCDTGPGVAPEDRDRIFGAFEQVGDPARSQSMTRGTGLGLTIARELSTLLHGQLLLAETSPEGSCFAIRIPLTFHAAQG